MEQAKFDIGVYHEEIRSTDPSVILSKAKEKMSIKYGYNFHEIKDECFEITDKPERQVHLVTIEVVKMKIKQNCCAVQIINDLCALYLELKEKGKL